MLVAGELLPDTADPLRRRVAAVPGKSQFVPSASGRGILGTIMSDS